MNKLVKYSVATLLATGLFGMSTQTTSAATNYQRLTHNAYAYNYNGQRANHKLYKKGSKVKVIGSITLNGKKYNIISGNVYIKTLNFKKTRTNTIADLGDGYETSLIRNSYVYNSKGQRIKGMKLRKNHSITYYGQPVRINGKKYVLIGANQYVRSSNVLLSYDGPTGSDSINHTHHNATNTTRRNGSKNSTSNSTSNSSSAKGSKQSNTSNKTNSDAQSSHTAQNGNRTTNTGNAQTTKGNLPTSEDYESLSEAIQRAQLINLDTIHMWATWPKQKAFDTAYSKALYYLGNRHDAASIGLTANDVKNVVSALDAARNNLDGNDNFDKRPKVKVLVYPSDEHKPDKYEWTPEEKQQTMQQVLDLVGRIYGSNDVHFMDKDDQTIGLNDADGNPHSFNTKDYIKEIDIYEPTGQVMNNY